LNPSHSPLAFLMPFLLWAAVRFGPAGASLSLLTTALVAIWAGTQGRGPFTRLPAAESVFALQIFLITVAIPLMCLAALIEERRRVEKALGRGCASRNSLRACRPPSCTCPATTSTPRSRIGCGASVSSSGTIAWSCSGCPRAGEV